jgi:hypothetical protein
MNRDNIKWFIFGLIFSLILFFTVNITLANQYDPQFPDVIVCHRPDIDFMFYFKEVANDPGGAVLGVAGYRMYQVNFSTSVIYALYDENGNFQGGTINVAYDCSSEAYTIQELYNLNKAFNFDSQMSTSTADTFITNTNGIIFGLAILIFLQAMIFLGMIYNKKGYQ